jgi:serine/threonine protein kinase
MALVFACKNDHGWLPDPWELASADCFPQSCIACGARVQLTELELPADSRPAVFPRGYDILGPLEGATMAAIYKARHQSSRRLVALKVDLVDPESAPGEREVTRREARLLGMLDHPHIVHKLAAGKAAGRAFLAVEWLGGGTLADLFCGGPMRPSRAVSIFARLSEALHHAHSNRVLHMDLRPTNIVFTVRGAPKLVDFGLSELLDEPGGRARVIPRGGDPRYMAPEQATDERQVIGPAADIHALGAVLYQALSGRLPYHGVCLNERLSRARIEIPSPKEFQPAVPHSLDRICQRCLEPNPVDRYRTAGELARALRRVVRAK